MEWVRLPEKPIECQNRVGAGFRPLGRYDHEIVFPYTGTLIGRSGTTPREVVDEAVQAAHTAARDWRFTPVKERAQVLFRFREVLLRDADTISHTIAAESGKLVAEAKAGLMKGVEVLEFALSLQNLDSGGRMEVSRGVFCEYRREPLGVVAGITPFNFPAMVPMWMIPIAIAVGNAFVWKPSDKTPLTSLLLSRAAEEAGLPPGVLTIVQGGRETVEAVIDHPRVRAVGFVGSTPVAKAVYARATALGKRALALGGAKNPIILMPDADPEVTIPGVVNSFTGCAGQRCMAASLLLAMPGTEKLLERIAERAAGMELGRDMGAIITREARDRLVQEITAAEKEGAKIRVDGRSPKAPGGYEGGHWLGATVLDGVKSGSRAAVEELFGPVLSVVHVQSLKEALGIAAQSRFGNAISVFTQSGATAEEVARHAHAGMVGINIGVPVPREPFSFGGTHESKFGHGEITGEGSLSFWTDLKKVTTKWSLQSDQTWMG